MSESLSGFPDSRPLIHQYPYLGAYVRRDLVRRGALPGSFPPRRLKGLSVDELDSESPFPIRAGDQTEQWERWFGSGGRVVPGFVRDQQYADVESALRGLLCRVKDFFREWKGYGVQLSLDNGLYEFDERNAFRELQYFAYAVSSLEKHEIDTGFQVSRLQFSPKLREVIDRDHL